MILEYYNVAVSSYEHIDASIFNNNDNDIILLVMIYMISNLALRENKDEFDNSLKNIEDITQVK